MSFNLAYRIALTEEEDVEQGMSGAPAYDAKVASAIARTIEMIHGIDDLHTFSRLDEVEVYIGRSSDSPRHLLGRWRSHRSTRGHQYAAVLFSCDSNRVRDLEAVAIKMMTRLKRYGTLCVANANVADSGTGGEPSTARSVVYMTWRTRVRPTEFEKPTMDVIRAVASEVSDEMDRVIARQQLQTGLMALKRLASRARIDWYPD